MCSRVVTGRKENTMDEIMNEVTNTEETAVQEPVVEAPSEPEAETVEQPAEQPQTRSENIRQAAMRRSRERDLQQQLAQMQNSNSQLMEALKDYGYSGSAEEVLNQLRAAKEGMSIEDYMAREEQVQSRAKELMQLDPEYQSLKTKAEAYEQMAFDNVVKEDLAAIKKAFPEEKARSVEELGEQFIALRAQGIDPIVAYSAVAAAKQATAKPKPPEMGAVGQKPVEKEYYSNEELDRLTDKDLDDPAVYKKAMSSLLRLGRKK